MNHVYKKIKLGDAGNVSATASRRLVHWTSERTVRVRVPLVVSWSRVIFLLGLTFVPTLHSIVLRIRLKTKVPCVNAYIRYCY